MFNGLPLTQLPYYPNLCKFFLRKNKPLRGESAKKDRLTNFRLASKIVLGVFFLSFFLNYQPILGIPPIKKNAVYAQAEQIQTISAQSLPLEFQLPHPGYISTYYSTYHPGVDLASGLGLPVKSIASGKVLDTGYNFWGLGLTVTVDHGHGYSSLYAHLGKIYVKKDQEITINDYIGEIGLTGNTSGPHTHLELYKDGKTTDPLAVLPKVREVPIAEDFKPVGGKGKPQIGTVIQPKTYAKASVEPNLTPQPKEESKNLNQNVIEITNVIKSDQSPKVDLRKDLQLIP
ncbi:M23 family metallopeptidase [Candidatus Daviesbacteria bacterium]|nr:M23 family metallopeptidase [Candidatus Daviesbacteria bacterium]